MNNTATNPEDFSNSNRRILIILAIFAVGLFIMLAVGVQTGNLIEWDKSIMRGMVDLHAPAVTTMFKSITYTASEIVVVTLAFASLLLWRWGRRRDMVLLLISWAGFSLIINGMKLIFTRSRPDVFDYLVNQSGHSFPSGHAAAAISLFGLLGIFLWQPKLRGFAFICWSWVILVAFSRVYLGVHYPSDVLASLSLGVAWLILLLSNRDRITGLFIKNDENNQRCSALHL